jgi:hypothetical protein
MGRIDPVLGRDIRATIVFLGFAPKTGRHSPALVSAATQPHHLSSPPPRPLSAMGLTEDLQEAIECARSGAPLPLSFEWTAKIVVHQLYSASSSRDFLGTLPQALRHKLVSEALCECGIVRAICLSFQINPDPRLLDSLSLLLEDDEVKKEIVETFDGVSILHAAIDSARNSVRHRAVRCIRLLCENRLFAVTFFHKGAFATLAGFLTEDFDDSPMVQRETVSALLVIAGHSTEHLVQRLEEDLVPH